MTERRTRFAFDVPDKGRREALSVIEKENGDLIIPVSGTILFQPGDVKVLDHRYSDFPLASRAPSIHGTLRHFAALRLNVGYWGNNGHQVALGPDFSVANDPERTNLSSPGGSRGDVATPLI